MKEVIIFIKLSVYQIALEVTRKCNLCCAGYCMRGNSQNIDLNKEIVDAIFDNENYDLTHIDIIVFSGGEPTLNPKIISYTINKIISKNISVNQIVMVTNGQIYNQEIVDSFHKFNDYKNSQIKGKSIERYKIREEIFGGPLNFGKNEYSRITFSNDQFHSVIPKEVKNKYIANAKGIRLTETGIKKIDEISNYGLSNIGEYNNYKLQEIKCFNENDISYLANTIYITANGNITTEGMEVIKIWTS